MTGLPPWDAAALDRLAGQLGDHDRLNEAIEHAAAALTGFPAQATEEPRVYRLPLEPATGSVRCRGGLLAGWKYTRADSESPWRWQPEGRDDGLYRPVLTWAVLLDYAGPDGLEEVP